MSQDIADAIRTLDRAARNRLADVTRSGGRAYNSPLAGPAKATFPIRRCISIGCSRRNAD
jgi:hypothetical protein